MVQLSIWFEMQRKCVAVVYSVYLFWLGVSLYFSSQKSQCKTGSSEVLQPGACSKMLA